MHNRRLPIYVLIILTLLTGLGTGRAFFFNLAYVLFGLLAVSWLWSQIAIRWLTIGRFTRTRRGQVGRPIEEHFQISNHGLLPKLWVEVLDHSTLPNHHASHVVPAMGIRSRYEWPAETVCIARGEFTLGPMSITSGDPFGLFVSTKHIEATRRIVVYPPTYRVEKFPLPASNISGGEAQRRRTHYVTTNAAGVRDYAYGDSFNRIDWKGTARRDRIVVKEFELDPMVDIWLFADFSSQSLVEDPGIRRIGENGPAVPTAGGVPPSTEEYAVVAAASLARHFIDNERALGFAAYTPQREVIQPDRGNRHLTRILETLAIARSHSQHSLAEMLMLETPYFTRGTTLVVVTASTRVDWIPSAQTLTRRGIRPLCVLIDAQSFGGTVSPEETLKRLQIARVPTVVVQRGDDIGRALSQTRY